MLFKLQVSSSNLYLATFVLTKRSFVFGPFSKKADLKPPKNIIACSKHFLTKFNIKSWVVLLAEFPRQSNQFNYSNYQQPWKFQPAIPLVNPVTLGMAIVILQNH